jgi:hypothetical protein
MAVRDVYLKIEQIDNYSAVAPMDKVAPRSSIGETVCTARGTPTG